MDWPIMPEALSNIRLDIFLTESSACKHGCEKISVDNAFVVYITFWRWYISDKNQSLFQEILPRLSPRLGVELIQKKIAAALKE